MHRATLVVASYALLIQVTIGCQGLTQTFNYWTISGDTWSMLAEYSLQVERGKSGLWSVHLLHCFACEHAKNAGYVWRTQHVINDQGNREKLDGKETTDGKPIDRGWSKMLFGLWHFGPQYSPWIRDGLGNSLAHDGFKDKIKLKKFQNLKNTELKLHLKQDSHWEFHWQHCLQQHHSEL